tara:strand:- start:1116 stop:1364 length:249 start_codon:yes stop_codon:yes gene_type:complete
MWVRIKGVLYNLSLVQNIVFDDKTHSLTLVYTGVIPYSNNYRNDSTYIEFDESEDALLAYKHIIKTIDIPQLQDSGFHNKNL